MIPEDQTAVPAGYMQDAKGRLVPESLVKPQQMLEDQLVRKVIGYADELSAQVGRFKGHCFDDVAAFMALLSESYGATKGGRKGNVTFTSFDGCLKVQVQVADRISFGPELQVAKDLIDECIAEWSEGSREEIRALVEHAFRTDKAGEVSREGIFALRRLEIDDERWKRAVEAIGESIRIVGSKSYIRFYRRSSPDEGWRAVSIDLAAA